MTKQAKDSKVQARIDEDLKNNVKDVLNRLGLNMSAAIDIYFHQIVQTQGLPFSVTVKKPSQETKQALNESREHEGETFEVEEAIEMVE